MQRIPNRMFGISSNYIAAMSTNSAKTELAATTFLEIVMKERRWQISVDQLIRIFQEAIAGVLPSLIRANLVDEKFCGYDGWDKIASTLFEEIVESFILWSLPEGESEKFKLPRYGFKPNSLVRDSFIQTVPAGQNFTGRKFCFVEVLPSTNPPGSPTLVKTVELDAGGHEGVERVFAFEDVSFNCVYRHGNDEIVLANLNVLQ